MKNKSREIIQRFIKDNGYTYKIEDILHDYQKYYIQGYYISYTMNHCITNLENEIKTLIYN